VRRLYFSPNKVDRAAATSLYGGLGAGAAYPSLYSGNVLQTADLGIDGRVTPLNHPLHPGRRRSCT